MIQTTKPEPYLSYLKPCQSQDQTDPDPTDLNFIHVAKHIWASKWYQEHITRPYATSGGKQRTSAEGNGKPERTWKDTAQKKMEV